MPDWITDRYQKIRNTLIASEFRNKPIEQVFTEIYEGNRWGNPETISGVGSTIDQMKHIIGQVDSVIAELGVVSLLDIPCGDFNWMKQVNLSTLEYIGADIVEEIIAVNNEKYKSLNINFLKLDITCDQLPPSDLVLNKDCFVHFSYHDISRAIENIKKSDCRFLMTTTFAKHNVNWDIDTGKWRPLNLERQPFNFPKPMINIEEQATKGWEKEFKGKSLAVWEIEKLPNFHRSRK